ncbi:Putative alcohol dehydrogenase, zinc-type, GroES-like superfamily, NAD(P)-binding domain superfamily [Septoria linicola]|uniref:Alcohol dehydrogenase, zinc-type, GroES-like superfamily, NAD(P)-binding domain superfamily n=1 Tax=Septoria linicola TaxID=215465 RepID=A0A9Q9AL10_9PEZI|nr:putative alcohol dehydrogenase, zinc-type, GroES-like superfamily, NAD(P)-binding domain superfamily [Septoria linicola]USW48385.1 Putative alcohol dehydrogenase, zinc-type, GroES-like superfamily, NAD(P)-binding domain superfamily [Septoria linicola]
MASATEIQASVLHAAKDLRVESRTVSPPEADEVQIRIASTGLCGSDLHYYSHFRNGDILVREPLSLGHESSGVITAVGSSVKDFQTGDKVALEVGLPCEKCQRCQEGRYNICPNVRFRSSGKAFPHFQGTLQERINHPAKWVYKLPEEISLDVGALLEPLGVALHAFRRSLMPENATVLVFGAGAVGLLCAAVAKLKGASKVIIADIDAGRLQFAVQNGFAHHSYTVPMKRGKDIDESLQIAKETAAEVGKVESVGEVDVVFECTGVPSCVQAGIYSTKPGGRIMLVGMGHPIQTLPLGAAALREVDIVGVFRYANTYKESIDIVLQASQSPAGPDFAKLITHRFAGLDEAVKAFEMAGKTKDADGKLVLKVIIDSSEGSKEAARL